MLNYAICEIGGKQYKIFPNKWLLIDWQREPIKNIEANVMLLSDDGKLKIGKPYLKEKLILKCLETVRNKKIRVAKFHAKANYRKVLGFRSKLTKIVLTVKNTS